MSEPKTLVTIVGDNIELAKLIKRDQFLQVVNTPPPTNWVKDHPFASKVKYLPIEKVELLLTRIFQEWHVEIRDSKQIMNSLAVTVRLHYKDPIDGEYRWQEGVGAVPAQTDKGAKASDMTAILSDAVMKGLPSAESFAIKDAAEKIGKLFGKDLNRRDVMPFNPTYDTSEAKTKLKEKLDEDTKS